MCGIIGFAREDDVVDMLTSGLEKLEYRGYDSAGIAVFSDGGIRTVKTPGRVSELKDKIKKTDIHSHTGIAHTRWATNGAPNEENAHPIVSEDSNFAVVHNGIIENAGAVRAELSAEGVAFSSDTDTESIAQLLMKNYSGDLLGCIVKTVNRLTGSFALGIMCRDCPGVIAAVRYLSPLTVGRGNGGFMIASDPSALIGCADECFSPNDGEIALITHESADFYTFAGEKINKTPHAVDGEEFSADKNGMAHFMLREIYEQPAAIERTLNEYLTHPDGFSFKNLTDDIVLNINRICFAACGSAWRAGQAARPLFERLLNIPCEAVLASEYRYSDIPTDKNTLVIAISQSGETADTLEAVKKAKKMNAPTLGIVNVRASYIARECGDVIYTLAGRETAVATTKGYTTQLAALYALGLYLARKRGSYPADELDSLTGELMKCPGKVSEALGFAPQAEKTADLLSGEKSLFFIGRQADYACALEAALKMKEISYIHSECCAAGELKHGTISLIEPGTKVFALACCESVADKTLNNINEVISRGADVICCTKKSLAGRFMQVCRTVILPDVPELFSPIVQVVPFQLIAYYTALKKGCDIDKPRNLAKSVTVE